MKSEYKPTNNGRIARPETRKAVFGDMAGLVAIVTGGASGIGRQSAAMLAELGAAVLIVDKDEAGACGVMSSLRSAVAADGSAGNPHMVHIGDLRDSSVGEQAVYKALKHFSRLDAVIFCAGIPGTGPLADLDDESFMATMRDNLLVHVGVTRTVLREARDGRWLGSACSLVYIVSKHAIAPSTGFGGYPIAKAGQLQLARLAALEGAEFGIRANAVNPGAVFEGSSFWNYTLLSEKAAQHGVTPAQLEDYYAQRTILGVRVTPDDVASAACFLASPRSRATTGALLNVDGGLQVSFGR